MLEIILLKVNLSLCLTNYPLRHEGVWVCGCIDPHFLDLGTSWRWVVSFTPRPLYPRGKSLRYPLDWRLGRNYCIAHLSYKNISKLDTPCQCTTHKAVKPFYKMTGRFKSQQPRQYERKFQVNWLLGHPALGKHVCHPEDWNSMFLRNVGKRLADYTALYPSTEYFTLHFLHYNRIM
jgi:hypothetical protein